VIWIETDPRAADVALLQVGDRSDGSKPVKIELAEHDAAPDSSVAVIGYPARAPSDVIPDQAWMERIYGGTYDIKRVAPGQMGAQSRGWATHDCTTLGGNSGSVVVDMATGRAVALHFAGLYLLENYAVPASTLRRYLREEPWRSTSKPPPPPPTAATETKRTSSDGEDGAAAAVPATFSIDIPLTITVSLGRPVITGASSASSGSSSASGAPSSVT